MVRRGLRQRAACLVLSGKGKIQTRNKPALLLIRSVDKWSVLNEQTCPFWPSSLLLLTSSTLLVPMDCNTETTGVHRKASHFCHIPWVESGHCRIRVKTSFRRIYHVSVYFCFCRFRGQSIPHHLLSTALASCICSCLEDCRSPFPCRSSHSRCLRCGRDCQRVRVRLPSRLSLLVQLWDGQTQSRQVFGTYN